MHRSTRDTCVVIPAYNEERVIGDVLRSLAPFPYRVIVVDDGSSDATVAEIAQHPVTLVRHSVNLGQGAALQTGVQYALLSPQTKYIVTFDSDGQHDPNDIAQVLAPLRVGTYDVALGSRFLRSADVEHVPLSRRITLKLALWLSRVTTGLALTDTHNGLRAFTAAAAARMEITQNRMAHASEILALIAQLHLRYCEVPVRIVYTEYSRAKGQSFLSGINILWDLVRGGLR